MKLKMPESINKDKVFEKTKGVKESILKNPKIKLVKDKIMATKRSKTIFFSGTSILIVLIIAFTVFGGSGDTVTKIPTLTYMQNGDLSERITASGTARPSDTTSVFIELSQKVKTVSVEVGDKVKEGELLITYDIEDTKKELENKVKSAELSLSDAKNNLNSLIKPASGTEKIDLEVAVLNSEKSLNNAKTELKNADISISGAEKKVSDAKTEMEVNKKLLDIGGVSQLEYDTSVQNYQNALANLSSEQTNKIIKENNVKAEELSYEKAKLNLQNGSNKLNDENTAINYKKQKNAVELAEMNLETARRNLEKLTEETYSPIDGTVIESSAVEGELLTDSKAIMKIADLSKIELDAYVSEYDISSVEVGQSVEITSDGIEGKVYTGKVVKIEPQASSQLDNSQ